MEDDVFRPSELCKLIESLVGERFTYYQTDEGFFFHSPGTFYSSLDNKWVKHGH
jgi:hypothetical protein